MEYMESIPFHSPHIFFWEICRLAWVQEAYGHKLWYLQLPIVISIEIPAIRRLRWSEMGDLFTKVMKDMANGSQDVLMDINANYLFALKELRYPLKEESGKFLYDWYITW